MASNVSSTLFSGQTAKRIFTRAFVAAYKDPGVKIEDISKWIKLTLNFEDPTKTLRPGLLFQEWIPKYAESFQSGALVFGMGVHARQVAAMAKYWQHEWLVKATLGQETVDHYSQSPLIKCNNFSHVSPELIQSKLNKFIGEIEQVNPRPLQYDLQQQKKFTEEDSDDEFLDSDSENEEFPARQIRNDGLVPCLKQCYSIELLYLNDCHVKFRIISDCLFNCRAFIRDLGNELDCPSSIDSLHLEKVGPVHHSQCLQKHELHYEQLVQCAQNLTPICIDYTKELRKQYPFAKANWRYI